MTSTQTMSKEYATGTAQSRREQSSTAKDKLYPYYRRKWRVKQIADVEENREELSDTSTRSAAQLLEVADIDTIVDTYEKQIAIQEKRIFAKAGSNLAIRIDNGTDIIAPEGKRLLASHTDPTVLVPTVICVAKIADGVEWLRLINTSEFVELWQSQTLTPTVYDGKDVNTKLFFDVEDIDNTTAIIGAWGEL